MNDEHKEVADEMAIECFRHLVGMLDYLDEVEQEERESVGGKGILIKCAGKLRDFVDDERMHEIEYPVDYEDVYDIDES